MGPGPPVVRGSFLNTCLTRTKQVSQKKIKKGIKREEEQEEEDEEEEDPVFCAPAHHVTTFNRGTIEERRRGRRDETRHKGTL